MAQREVIDILKKYLLALQLKGLAISEARLYGSYVRNEANNESDIDVLLLSDNVNFNDDKNTGIIWTTAFAVDPRIEPYGVSKKKFIEDDYLPLFENVKSEGIEIKV